MKTKTEREADDEGPLDSLLHVWTDEGALAYVCTNSQSQVSGEYRPTGSLPDFGQPKAATGPQRVKVLTSGRREISSALSGIEPQR